MSDDAIIIERLQVLSDRVEAIHIGQIELRKAIESGPDNLQVRMRLLEDRVGQDRLDRDRMMEQQATLRAQLIATIVGVILTALGSVVVSLV